MYQNLKLFVPPSPSVPDDRSVHFLMVPKVNKSYFDSAIERTVSRMQKVIELGRYLREKNILPLKTPLRELVVISNDPQYLEDVKSLESYIYEELNIRTLTLTSEEVKYGVKYKLVPDNKVLGQKLKKEAGKVKAALGKLTEEDARKFHLAGKIEVAGFELCEEDLNVCLFILNDLDCSFRR
jgi:isoleucyl-tRNA synthetase